MVLNNGNHHFSAIFPRLSACIGLRLASLLQNISFTVFLGKR